MKKKFGKNLKVWIGIVGVTIGIAGGGGSKILADGGGSWGGSTGGTEGQSQGILILATPTTFITDGVFILSSAKPCNDSEGNQKKIYSLTSKRKFMVLTTENLIEGEKYQFSLDDQGEGSDSCLSTDQSVKLKKITIKKYVPKSGSRRRKGSPVLGSFLGEHSR